MSFFFWFGEGQEGVTKSLSFFNKFYGDLFIYLFSYLFIYLLGEEEPTSLSMKKQR
jgi:hypothetical protein